MKKIKFDARFKEAILSKKMVATIRNDKKVDVGEVFEIIINNELIGKAECKRLIKWDRCNFLHYAEGGILYNMNEFTVFNNYNLRARNCGFNGLVTLVSFYKPYLKNEHCYLHIFELEY